mgnify:CR=1 FL=1
MLLHYIKMAVRQLLKYKFHTIVSALCMAIGLTVNGYLGTGIKLNSEQCGVIDITRSGVTPADNNWPTGIEYKQLVEKNIEDFKKKTLPCENITIVQGDAVNLHMLKNDEYDIVLHLGPMYHLSAESERKAAVSEALRVTKPNGIVFMAYILNEMTVINYFFRNGHINEAEARENIISSNWRFKENKKRHLSFYRIEDINALMSGFDVHRLHLVGTEMISGAMRELLLSMSDEEFACYTEYIYSICERPDMIGLSGHLLDIFEKK